MSLARLVIIAVTVKQRSKSEVARDYGVSRVWVQKLVHRYQREGPAAFEPCSRRPHTNPRAVDLDVEDLPNRALSEDQGRRCASAAARVLATLRAAPRSVGCHGYVP
jgi:transposase